MRQLRSNLIRSAALPVDLGLYVPVVFELPPAWSAHCTMPATMLHVPPAVDLHRGGGGRVLPRMETAPDTAGASSDPECVGACFAWGRITRPH